MSDVMIVLDGLEKFADETGDLPRNVTTAITRSINRTLDRTRTRAARAILDQVAFPASYLGPARKRLWVRQRARNDSLFGSIEGRDSATSLARFAKQKVPTAGSQRPKGNKIDVRVKPGGGFKAIPRAFLIKLRNNNVGLAVRTNGFAPPGAFKPKEISKNLWLLYGPSVDQALLAATDGQGVYEELTPEALDFMTSEFNRQMDLLEGSNA
jgi:hypothetical protein